MELKIKVLALIAITVIGLAMPLSAQTSNQKQATAGVFGTDVDKYMNVNKYGNVNFSKWFGYLGGSTSGELNLGYATRFSGIYLGTFYTGGIFSSETSVTKTLETSWDPVLQRMTERVDSKTYGDTSDYTDNSIGILIGVAGMGIKVGFSEDTRKSNTPFRIIDGDTFTVTQNDDGTISYTGNDTIKYKDYYQDLTPSLQWGMKLDLGGMAIAPRVGTSISFIENKHNEKYYFPPRTEYNGKIIGTEDIRNDGWTGDHTEFNISAGGDFYLDSSMYVGIDYTLYMDTYKQSLGAAGRKGSVGGSYWYNRKNTTDNYLDRTVKYEAINVGVREQKDTYHSIVPAFWKENALGENLKLGVLVKIPITFGSSTNSYYQDSWETSETAYLDPNDQQNNTTTVIQTHNADEKNEYSSFEIAPNVGVGVSYDLIPKKFTVNAGIKVNVPSYSSIGSKTSPNGVDSTYTKTETGTGNNKVVSETLNVTAPTTITDSVHKETEWLGLSGSIVGGFVFSFNDNFALDLLASTNNSFSFDLTKLRVLFSIKF